MPQVNAWAAALLSRPSMRSHSWLARSQLPPMPGRAWPALIFQLARVEAPEETVDIETAYPSLGLPTRRWLQRRLDEDLARGVAG